jgi:regulatory protein
MLFSSAKNNKSDIREVKQKTARFCAYQERCISDVKRKLSSLQVTGEEADTIIDELIDEGFLNEERFAKVFASGKFRLKGWGRIKIYRALQAKGMQSTDIRKALDEIDETEYRQTLKTIMEKKERELTEDDFAKRKQKLINFALGRGFESEVVWEAIRELGM